MRPMSRSMASETVMAMREVLVLEWTYVHEGLFFLGAANNKADGARGWRVFEFLNVLDEGDEDRGVLLLGACLALLGGFQLVEFAWKVLVAVQSVSAVRQSPRKLGMHLCGAAHS